MKVQDTLASGCFQGTCLKIENQQSQGVVVVDKNGKKLFIPKLFVDMLRYRNRGKD